MSQLNFFFCVCVFHDRMPSALTGGGESCAKHTHQQSNRAARLRRGAAIWRRRAILQDHRRSRAERCLPELPSGRWAAPFPLVPALPFPPSLSPQAAWRHLSLSLSLSRPAFVVLSLHFPSLPSPFFFAFICRYIPPRPAKHRKQEEATKTKTKERMEKKWWHRDLWCFGVFFSSFLPSFFRSLRVVSLPLTRHSLLLQSVPLLANAKSNISGSSGVC